MVNTKITEAFRFLQQIADLRTADKERRPLLSNQGQALDGFSLLAGYNSIADKVTEFLKQE